MKASIKSTLLGLGITVTVLPAISMFAFMAFMGHDIVKTANDAFRNSVLDAAKQSTLDIRKMCDAIVMSDGNISDAARSAIFESLNSLGKISFAAAPSEFSIFSREDSDNKKKLFSPLLKFGEYTASPDVPESENELYVMISALKERLHCDISILYKVPDSDMFVRVASTFLNSSGESITGSYVSPNKRTEATALLRDMVETKLPVSGIVTVNKIPYSANYIPLTTEKGEFAGAIYYGFPMPSVGELEKLLQSSYIGETGAVWVIDVSDSENPVLRVSRDLSSVGTRVNDDPHEARRLFERSLIDKSRLLANGEIGVETVKVRSRDGKREISRMVTYTMYEPWRWIIGTSLDADEFSGSESALISRIGYFTRRVGYAGAIFTLLAIGVAWILASQMSKPLKLLRKVARYHSRGDMLAAGAALESYTEKGGSRIEEFDTLIRGISDMTSTLSSLIKSVRDDGESAAAGAEKISALALAMESVALSEVASIRRVATTGKAISLSADSINKEARASASQVAKTLEIGRECGDSLQSLKRNYDALYAAAEGITRRLSIIDGNAEKITSVATAIAEINKRTNILSLNASIEAEKAGEVGLGFAVVARQIRRLADKTSKSASDIEIAVKQMQSAVNSGVMEMDRFGASMRQSLKIVLETADSLSRVVGDVEGIAPKFENIAMRISALSENARGIGETMTALSGSSVTARDTAMEFKSATAALGATSDSLLGEVSRFKVSEGGGAK